MEQLIAATKRERESLLGIPVIRRALCGDITREVYVGFLTQAYHHVRHTVPLLMAVGARLPARSAWLQEQLIHYLEEEQGHEQWVLNDIRACGADPQRVRDGAPAVQTDAMVAYAYDTVMRRNPLGFFGMVHVLEGTSVALALAAAEAIQRALALPDRAFSYLRSHGALDREHVGHLASIVNRLDTEHDLPCVISCARAMYWLYGNLFHGLTEAASHEAFASRRSA